MSGVDSYVGGSWQSQWGGYSYDESGAATQRVMGDANLDFTRDADGRIRFAVISDGGPVSSGALYRYDADGARAYKSVGAFGFTVKEHLYVTPEYEVDTLANSHLVHVFVGRTRVATLKRPGLGMGGDPESETVVQYHPNHVGSNTMLTNAAGGVIKEDFMEPFGDGRVTVAGSGGAVSLPSSYVFTDQEHDPETGLDYFGARYYDPMIGRFLSSDPALIGSEEGPTFRAIAGDGQASNPFAYAMNRPTVVVDPTGAWAVDIGALLETEEVEEPEEPGWPTENVYECEQCDGYDGHYKYIPIGAGQSRSRSSGSGASSQRGRSSESGGSPGGGAGIGSAVGTAFRWLVYDYKDPLLGSYLLEAATLIPVAKIAKGGKLAVRGLSVIGHRPDYLKRAGELGARRFSIPGHVWDRMSDGERWAANQKFLDRAIRRGDFFDLATPLDKVKPGSYCEREIGYLLEHGYRVSPDGSRLLPR